MNATRVQRVHTSLHLQQRVLSRKGGSLKTTDQSVSSERRSCSFPVRGLVDVYRVEAVSFNGVWLGQTDNPVCSNILLKLRARPNSHLIRCMVAIMYRRTRSCRVIGNARCARTPTAHWTRTVVWRESGLYKGMLTSIVGLCLQSGRLSL